MKISKVLVIIGLILWLGLGMIVLNFQENQEIVLTWASTTGIMFLLMISLEIKRREDALCDLPEGDGKK